ncbi:phage protease [Pseudomonas aeruginosa]|nr:phage protease [Pseudomonas aeruginosa]WMF54565.1 phage protease [Pseudomonas aeruginosa]
MTNDPAIDGLEPLARRAAATFGLYKPRRGNPCG